MVEEARASGSFRPTPNSPTPLYHQVYLWLRERILSGELGAGTLLAGEQDMARQLDVSRITIKRAFNELAARGFVHRHRGRGTIVAGGAVVPLVAGAFDTLLESLQRMGLRTEVELLDVEDGPATAHVAARLALAVGAPVQRARRLRRLEGQPFSHLVSWAPADVASGWSREALASSSMLALFAASDIALHEAEQWIGAVAAPTSVAAALDVAPGAPLLKIERVMRSLRRRAVHYVEAHYRADRFHYHLRTRRDGRGATDWELDG